jgi:hypothetical protein
MAKAKTQSKDEPALFETPAAQGELESGNQVEKVGAVTTRPRSKKTVEGVEVHQRAMVRAEPPPPPTVLTDYQATLASLERLATRKDVNPDALDRIVALMERIEARQAKARFDAAFVVVQPKLVAAVLPKSGRIEVKAKDQSTGQRTGKVLQDTPYPKYEEVAPIIIPILNAEGFSLTHRTERTPEGRLKVTAVLTGHGHEDATCSLEFEADTTGSKNNAQAWVSVQSYGRRATSFSRLNLVAKGEDDDGAKAGRPVVGGDPLSADQTQQLFEICAATGADRDKFLAFMNRKRPNGHPEAKEIGHLPASRFEEAIEELRLAEEARKAVAEKDAHHWRRPL